MISNLATSLRTIAIRKNAINSQLNQINKSISSLSLRSSPNTSTITHPSLTTSTRSLHSSTSSFNQSTSTSQSSTASSSSSNHIWEAIQDSIKSSNPSNLKSSSSTSTSSSSFQSFVQAAESNFKRRITLGQSSPNDPTSGRQILVNKHEVEKAYRQLSNVIRRNNLRWELKLGERYEKPNQTKRRKRSERHRRRFKDLVRSKVQLVSMKHTERERRERERVEEESKVLFSFV